MRTLLNLGRREQTGFPGKIPTHLAAFLKDEAVHSDFEQYWDKNIVGETLEQIRQLGNDNRSNRLARLGRLYEVTEVMISHYKDFDFHRQRTLPSREKAEALRNAVNEEIERHIRKKWRGINPKKLYMDASEVKTLVEHAEKGKESRIEYSGGARIIKTPHGFQIMPVYSSIVLKESEAPLGMEQMLASDSHLLWHTHPTESSGARNNPQLSFSDIVTSGISNIPILMATQTKEGKTPIEITVRGKQYPVAIKTPSPIGTKKRSWPTNWFKP
ncbi:hypothetical protein HY994_05045 [Candidatus Micrarchaeota archaeon]|nr:hypothetical protein [Candidatus Micrarchaeota archaeon]